MVLTCWSATRSILPLRWNPSTSGDFGKSWEMGLPKMQGITTQQNFRTFYVCVVIFGMVDFGKEWKRWFWHSDLSDYEYLDHSWGTLACKISSRIYPSNLFQDRFVCIGKSQYKYLIYIYEVPFWSCQHKVRKYILNISTSTYIQCFHDIRQPTWQRTTHRIPRLPQREVTNSWSNAAHLVKLCEAFVYIHIITPWYLTLYPLVKNPDYTTELGYTLGSYLTS